MPRSETRAEVQRFRKSTPASRSWSFCRAFRQPPERFCRQEFIVQNLRQRAERNAFVEQALQFDIAARECVAYDYEIRTGLRFVAAKAARRNAQGFEKRRHRRIGSRVRASDAETALLQHASERRHRRATDTDEVNVFFLGHLISWIADCRSQIAEVRHSGSELLLQSGFLLLDVSFRRCRFQYPQFHRVIND